MGKIETVLRTEIVRLAKKQVRTACQPLAREVRRLKRVVAELSKAVRSFEGIAKDFAAKRAKEATRLEADPAEVKKARISGGLVKKLRKRLGLSQAALGKLLGVTSAAVVFWEQGRSRPTPGKKAGLVALRKLGRRQVRRLLEAAQ
ncbi:MAG TPA: helix-turn-helix domain-containing protein [Planctomycetota bacterium]|nr:helix-turn-helix domain-containing protein [Planctomycetota bacterium]